MSTDKPIEPKALEFKLKQFSTDGGIYSDVRVLKISEGGLAGHDVLNFNETLHVIEYKALQKYQEELKKVNRILQDSEKRGNMESAAKQDYWNKLSALQTELDSFKDLHTRMTTESIEQNVKITALELVNNELQTKVETQAVTFMELYNKPCIQCEQNKNENTLLSAQFLFLRNKYYKLMRQNTAIPFQEAKVIELDQELASVEVPK